MNRACCSQPRWDRTSATELEILLQALSGGFRLWLSLGDPRPSPAGVAQRCLAPAHQGCGLWLSGAGGVVLPWTHPLGLPSLLPEDLLSPSGSHCSICLHSADRRGKWGPLQLMGPKRFCSSSAAALPVPSRRGLGGHR